MSRKIIAVPPIAIFVCIIVMYFVRDRTIVVNGQHITVLMKGDSKHISSSWKIRWSLSETHGLTIEEAWFTRSADLPPVKILSRTGLSNIFVPYASGSPRIWDMDTIGDGDGINLVNQSNLNKNVLTNILYDFRNRPVAVAEFYDRGVSWRNDTSLQRGTEFSLWASNRYQNYHYILNYRFTDDGAILLSCGATGRNNPERPFEHHMHNFLWMINPALTLGDQAPVNTVHTMERLEPSESLDMDSSQQGLVSRIDMQPFNGGIEGKLSWNAERFSMITVSSSIKTNGTHPVSYDFHIPRNGVARHYGPNEQLFRSDVFVTAAKSSETKYRNVLEYCSNLESIVDQNITVWCTTSMQHVPRAEDGSFILVGGKRMWKGATLTMWSGLELRPRNLFSGTPHVN